MRAGRRAAARAALFSVLRIAEWIAENQRRDPSCRLTHATGASSRCRSREQCVARMPCRRSRGVYARDAITLGWEERLKARGRRTVGYGSRVRHGPAARNDSARRRLLRSRRGPSDRRGGRAGRAGVRHQAGVAGGVGALRVPHRQQPSADDDRRRGHRLPGRAGDRCRCSSNTACRFRAPCGRSRRSARLPDHRHAVALSLLSLLHLCDSLFPTGGFAHSDGLEAATARRAGVIVERSPRLDGRLPRRDAWRASTVRRCCGRGRPGPSSAGPISTRSTRRSTRSVPLRPRDRRAVRWARGCIKTWQEIHPAGIGVPVARAWRAVRRRRARARHDAAGGVRGRLCDVRASTRERRSKGSSTRGLPRPPRPPCA